MPMRRKKWTEEEEETLIAKYGELLQSAFLSKAKSRERKFEPIAAHVNSLFHAQNPVAYPWLWTWKDASIKVQNMRHQYLGVKQKIKKVVPSSVDPAAEHEEYEWGDGLSIWSNFLKYKSVFGDQEADTDEFYATNPSVSLRHHHTRLHTAHLQQEHQHPRVQSLHHLSVASSSSLPFAHATSFPLESKNDTVHLLPKNFPDAGDGLANSHAGLLLECPKDGADAVVHQVVLDGDPGDLPSSLGFSYHEEGDGDGNNGQEHVLKDRGKEYEEPMDNSMDLDRQKRQRLCAGFGSRVSNLVTDSCLFAFMSSQFAELHEREAKREERELEREKERERRQAIFEAEKLKQMQEWERERREMEEARRNEVERQDAELREQELKFRLVEQQRESIEREKERERDERMERERMLWREKMEKRAMQHQADMMQIQMQIAQCLQNYIAVLTGAVSQLAGEGNDATGQPNSNNALFSQLLQSLQTQGNGTAHYGMRRGTGESSDSQFDVDG